MNRAAELRWACIAASCAACALGFATLSPVPVGAFWDDAVYVILGKAIATGEGYRYIHLPGEPAATLYPPLWPTLLSFVWRVSPEFPENVRVMRLINPLLLGVTAVGATLLSTQLARVRPWIAALAALACISVTPTLMVSSGLMSEPLGTALTAFALIAATATVMRGGTREGVAAGLLVALAVLARSVSVVLSASLAVGLFWTRSRRASAVSLAVAVPPIASWFLWSTVRSDELPAAIAGSYGSYARWMLGAYGADPLLAIEVAQTNAATIIRELGIVVFGVLPAAVRPMLTVSLVALTFACALTAGRRAAPLAATLGAYAALVLVWPYNPGRFVWAFLPFAAVALVAGLSAAKRRLRHRRWQMTGVRAAIGLAALAGFTLAIGDVRGLRHRAHANALERNAQSVLTPLAWIERNTAAADTIATDLHLYAHLYLDRIAVPLSTLTAREYLHPKTIDEMRAELRSIDSVFRPAWFVASGGTAQSSALRAWAAVEPSRFVAKLPLPAGGVALRTVR